MKNLVIVKSSKLARFICIIDCNKVYLSAKLFGLSGSANFLIISQEEMSERMTNLIDKVTRRKVYFYEGGRDCDGVSSASGTEYNNIYEAEASQEKAYQWADGPLYFTRITKEEYNGSESYYRDYGTEAYEDGHAHNLHG